MGIVWLLLKIAIFVLVIVVAGLIVAAFSPIRARGRGLFAMPQNDGYSACLNISWVYGLVAFELEAAPAGQVQRFKLAGFTLKEERTRSRPPEDGPGAPLPPGDSAPPAAPSATDGSASRENIPAPDDEIVFDLSLFGEQAPPEAAGQTGDEDIGKETREPGKLARAKQALAFLKTHKRLILDLFRALYRLGRGFLKSFKLRLDLLQMDLAMDDLATLGQVYGLTAALHGYRPDLFGAIRINPDFAAEEEAMDVDARGELSFSTFRAFLAGAAFFLRPCVWKAVWVGYKLYKNNRDRASDGFAGQA